MTDIGQDLQTKARRLRSQGYWVNVDPETPKVTINLKEGRIEFDGKDADLMIERYTKMAGAYGLFAEDLILSVSSEWGAQFDEER